MLSQFNKILSSSLLTGLLAVSVNAQEKLTINDITVDGGLSGSVPRGLKFSPDGNMVTFLKGSDEDSRVLDLWAYDPDEKSSKLIVKASDITGGKEELSEEERGRRERMRITNLGIVDFSWSDDGRKLLFPLGGDLYEYSLENSNTRRLTNSSAYELDSRFSPMGNYASYIEDNNIHIVDVRTGAHKKLTSSSSPTIKNGVAEFVSMEEMDRDTGYWWSNDEKYIAYIQFDEAGVDQRGRYEVVRDGFNVLEERYPRAGTNNVTVKLGILSIETGETTWIDLGKEKDIYLPRVDWVSDSSGIFFQKENRSQTRIDLIFAAAESGETRVVLTETSDQWLNLNHGLQFIRGGKEFLWQSERSGYNHIYHYSVDGSLINQLTDGNWVVSGRAKVDETEGIIYFSANANTVLERHLYKINLDSDKVSNPERISKRDGWHDVTFSSGNIYIDYFSNVDTPPQVSIHNLSGERLMWVEENKLDNSHPYYSKFDHHVSSEFGSIKNKNGDDLHYRMYKPANMVAGKKYPVIFALYGGPGAQVVRNDWNSLIHQVYAQDGYIVFRLDNRGSAGRGTVFAEALYHHMGKVEVDDQVAGAEFLKTLDYVDGDRIGIIGHSYGGYMVLMSMFTAPDTFKVGVSGAPVTDWRLYDTHYTERFLGHPDINVDGYEKSSVFPYVNNLKGKLLILHGMADDNVLFNHTSMLIDELQQQAIQFDMMAYPGQTHRLGADRMRNRHVLETQKRYFDENLK